MIFFIRFVTATCLFAFLGKANIWLTPLSNVLLAIGYRFFLVLSPIFDRAGRKYAVSVALIFAMAGSIMFFSHSEWLLTLGALFVSVGLSVSGYLIKVEAAETSTGAAFNKIALNAGSLLAGLILLLNSKFLFLSICTGILLFTSIISFLLSRKKADAVTLPLPKKFHAQHFIAWMLIGVAIGIKLFGVFSVLPQYLISHHGHLPNWYGFMILLNSIIVILFQLPIIRWIERFRSNNNAFKIVLFSKLIGMVLIIFPEYFNVQNVEGAIVWTLLLSLVECFASYLDVQSSRDGFLFIKEIAVGVGAGLTVLLSRQLEFPFSAISIGFLGIGVILIAYLFLYKNFLTVKKQE